jgi:hypothetical protein
VKCPAGSRRQAARAAVAFGAAFVVLAMVGMSAAVETVMPEWRDPEYGHRITRLHAIQRESPDRPLVIVFGTSRTQNAISPAAMGFPDEPGSPHVFNFGQSASPPLRVLLNYLRVRDSGIRPAAVVIEVQPLWLAVENASAESYFSNKVDRLSSADLQHLAPYCNEPEALRKKWLTLSFAPWHTHRLVLMSHWLPRWQEWRVRVDFRWQSMDPDGFVPFPHEDPPQHIRVTAAAFARQERLASLGGFRLAEASLRPIRDFVTLCRHEGIPVALIETPVSAMFRGWFSPGAYESGEVQLRDFVRELGVEFFPPFEGLAEADFVDGHHMLRRAAEKYSRWLADTHLKPWLHQQGVHR